MTRYPDLFGYAPNPYRGEPPAQAHSPTSQAAAVSVKKSIGPLHKKILEFLNCEWAREYGGATDEELMESLDMSGNTERPRRRELQLMNLIEDSGKTRPTNSGREAVVWKLS